MPEVTGHHHVALSVSDCAASAAWYQRVLGFVELFSEDGVARKARVLAFAQGGYSVGLVQHGPGADQRFDPARIGLDHTAFGVATRADLDEWAGHLTDLGIDHSGVLEIPAGAILNFADPDGIALALFWDAAG